MIAIMFEALSQLANRELTLSEGEILFRFGDPVRSLFLVASGGVRLVRHLPHGAALTLQSAEQGSILAEASMFATRYHCDAVALSAARILVLSRRYAIEALTDDPALALLWAKHLTLEIHRSRTQVEIMSLKTVEQRLDAWLALRGDLPSRGQWHRLASEIGVTAEALYRELARRRRSRCNVDERGFP